MCSPNQSAATNWQCLTRAIIECSLCPRLAAYRTEVARVKRRKYQNLEYWGKPVPGWGDDQARLLVLGLAPGAHGANRTGRPFSGDDSGDFLISGFARAGLITTHIASQEKRLENLPGVYITNAVRCAPPDNRPTGTELARCAPYLTAEYHLLARLGVILALGAVAFRVGLNLLQSAGQQIPSPRPKFAHGCIVSSGKVSLVGSYHPSRRNTQTGRLTPDMLDDVLQTCLRLANKAEFRP